MLEVWDFYADWCPPCKMMGPIIEELEKEYAGKVSFKKINIDENQALASEYSILSIPTYVFKKNGQTIDQASGMLGKDGMKKKIEEHLK